MIDFVCAKCGAVYHSDPFQVGKWIQCRRCAEPVPILEAGAVLISKQKTAVAQTVGHPRASTPKHRKFSSQSVLLVTGSVLVSGVLVWICSNYIATHQSSGRPEFADSHSETSSAAARNENPEPSPEFEIVDGEAADSPSKQLKEAHHEIAHPPSSYRSLTSGSPTCSESEYGGRGVLNVENGTVEDAELRLFDSNTNQVIRCFFVKARDSVRIEEIPERTYMLRYSSGLDWDETDQEFQRNPSYSEFERQFVYAEIKVKNSVEYDEISVTLHPVVGGNVRTKPISREQFLGTVRQDSNP